MDVIISEPLFGKIIKIRGKYQSWAWQSITEVQSWALMFAHGRMQFLLWQRSWRIVEQTLSGEFEGQGNNNSVSKTLCNLCMRKKWVLLWTVTSSFRGTSNKIFVMPCLMIYEGVSSPFKQMEGFEGNPTKKYFWLFMAFFSSASRLKMAWYNRHLTFLKHFPRTILAKSLPSCDVTGTHKYV